MRSSFVGLACAASFLMSACGDDAPTTDYELSGVVTDAETGDPLRAVTVTFTSDTLYRGSGTTDDDGYYAIAIATDVPFGQVRAEKAGYTPEEATVYFDTRTRRLDLALASP